MSKLITASIDLTKINKAKLFEGKKGGKWLNLTIWLNDKEDQYGNDVSIQQSLSKEEREAGANKIYLGNGKQYKQHGAVETTQTEEEVDLPF